MSNQNNWISETPTWFWLSLVPVFGSLAITYAGNKAKNNSWKYYGLALLGVGLVLVSTDLAVIVWILQVVTSFSVKQQYSVKALPRTSSIKDRETAKLLAQQKGQIEINSCSKDELVYELDLPIAYANDIECLRDEGHIFTSVEEMGDLTGIPDRVLNKIEPLITFEYNLDKESDVSWRRLNHLSVEDLMTHNLDQAVATKIVQEREKAGSFKSLIDVRKRTGLPLSYYKDII